MLTTAFPRSGAAASLLGFGCMRLPTLPDGSVDYPQTKAMIDRAMRAGINYYDTAYCYHDEKSEEILARALADYPRESYLLADKMPMWLVSCADDCRSLFAEQQRRCRSEYFDFYLAHSLSENTIDLLARPEILGFLTGLRETGAVRELGFSFHDDALQLRRVLDLCDWDFCQLQINYADWANGSARVLYDIAAERGLPVIVMEPVRGGFLASPPEEVAALLSKAAPERSFAEWAMRFAAALPQVRVVLSGMSTPHQLEDNLKAMSDFAAAGRVLSTAEAAVITRAGELLNARRGVACTNCRYCTDCPFGVKIPEIFRLMNDQMLDADPGAPAYFHDLCRAGRGPDHCTACGKCAALCPQHIDIPTVLRQAEELFAAPEANTPA